MEKKIEGLRNLGVNAKLKGDRVTFENKSGIVVHKLGDGFSVKQDGVHEHGGRHCEWVSVNGFKLARTPWNDFRIYTAIKDMFLDYEVDAGSGLKYEWLGVASDGVKCLDGQVLEQIDAFLNGALVEEVFDMQKWVVGQDYADIPFHATLDFNVTTIRSQLYAVDREVAVRYSLQKMRPTLHSVFLL